MDFTFGIKDLVFLHYVLGFEVSYHMDGISLTQRKFTQDLLKVLWFLHTKPTATPLPVNLKLNPKSGVPLDDPLIYITYVGKLNFLSNTGLDISFAAQILSQSCKVLPFYTGLIWIINLDIFLELQGRAFFF